MPIRHRPLSVCFSFFFYLMATALLLSGTTTLLHAADAVDKTKPAAKEDPLRLQQVTDNVYAIVGPLGNRTANNLGNNATFGFIVTAAGVVLVDTGGTYKGAQRIHDIIKSVTQKPVKYVINTGGQDHRWLGNDYFQKQGAKVIASRDAVQDQKHRLNELLLMLANTAGDAVLQGTTDSYADITFDKRYTLKLDGEEIEIIHPGGAHTPGDAFVWLPRQKVMFTGDIAYSERMLGVMSYSNSKKWLQTYEAMAAYHPQHVVPGHGRPTTLETINRDTYRYLTGLRQKVSEFMEAGGAIEDISTIDQSQFRYLKNYDSLKGRNAQQVYQEMEFE